MKVLQAELPDKLYEQIKLLIDDSVEKPLFWKTNKNSIQSYQQLTTRGFSKKGKFGTFSTES